MERSDFRETFVPCEHRENTPFSLARKCLGCTVIIVSKKEPLSFHRGEGIHVECRVQPRLVLELDFLNLLCYRRFRGSFGYGGVDSELGISFQAFMSPSGPV